MDPAEKQSKPRAKKGEDRSKTVTNPDVEEQILDPQNTLRFASQGSGGFYSLGPKKPDLTRDMITWPKYCELNTDPKVKDMAYLLEKPSEVMTAIIQYASKEWATYKVANPEQGEISQHAVKELLMHSFTYNCDKHDPDVQARLQALHAFSKIETMNTFMKTQKGLIQATLKLKQDLDTYFNARSSEDRKARDQRLALSIGNGVTQQEVDKLAKREQNMDRVYAKLCIANILPSIIQEQEGVDPLSFFEGTGRRFEEFSVAWTMALHFSGQKPLAPSADPAAGGGGYGTSAHKKNPPSPYDFINVCVKIGGLECKQDIITTVYTRIQTGSWPFSMSAVSREKSEEVFMKVEEMAAIYYSTGAIEGYQGIKSFTDLVLELIDEFMVNPCNSNLDMKGYVVNHQEKFTDPSVSPRITTFFMDAANADKKLLHQATVVYYTGLTNADHWIDMHRKIADKLVRAQLFPENLCNRIAAVTVFFLALNANHEKALPLDGRTGCTRFWEFIGQPSVDCMICTPAEKVQPPKVDDGCIIILSDDEEAAVHDKRAAGKDLDNSATKKARVEKPAPAPAPAAPQARAPEAPAAAPAVALLKTSEINFIRDSIIGILETHRTEAGPNQEALDKPTMAKLKKYVYGKTRALRKGASPPSTISDKCVYGTNYTPSEETNASLSKLTGTVVYPRLLTTAFGFDTLRLFLTNENTAVPDWCTAKAFSDLVDAELTAMTMRNHLDA